MKWVSRIAALRSNRHLVQQTELVERGCEIAVVSCSEGQHRDKSGDGDDDARYGECRPEFDTPQVAHGDIDKIA